MPPLLDFSLWKRPKCIVMVFLGLEMCWLMCASRSFLWCYSHHSASDSMSRSWRVRQGGHWVTTDTQQPGMAETDTLGHNSSVLTREHCVAQASTASGLVLTKQPGRLTWRPGEREHEKVSAYIIRIFDTSSGILYCAMILKR